MSRGCEEWSWVVLVHYRVRLHPYSTDGAKPSGSELLVLVRQLQPWKLQGFDRDVNMISWRTWRDLEEELLLC